MADERIYSDRDCGWCKGTGKGRQAGSPTDTCPPCDGTGKQRDYLAEARKRHTDRGRCPAIIRHGPGRQSYTLCERKLNHPEAEHKVVVHVWLWEGDEASVDDWGQVIER